MKRLLLAAAVVGIALVGEARAFNTYTNIALKTVDRDKVVQTLRDLQRRAYVSPVVGGYVVVYDAATEREPDTLFDVAVKLSASLKCPVIAAYDHNDSLLILITVKDGRRVDTYVSNPGYFAGKREPPKGGDVKTIQAALGVAGKDEALKSVLQSQIYDYEYDRHDEVIKLLDLPEYCSRGGHKYFHDDTLPWKYERKAFTVVGQP